MAFCTSCGAPLQEDALFCTVCGTKVISVPAAPADPYPPQPVSARQAPPEALEFPAPPVQPAQPVQPAPRPAYSGGQPLPPETGRYNTPSPPAYPAYRQPGNDWGRYDPPPRNHGKKALKHKGALRFLSFLSALGLLAFFIGLGSGIYFNRFVDQSVNGYTEQNKLMKPMGSELKTHFAGILSGAIGQDAKQITVEMDKYLNLSRDTSPIERLTRAALEQDPAVRELMQQAKAGKEQFGIRWAILEIGLRSRPLIIAGGILAALSLLLWLSLGGRPSNMTRAANTPLLTMFIIWGVCIVILALVIAPVNFFDIEMAAEPEIPVIEMTEEPEYGALPAALSVLFRS